MPKVSVIVFADNTAHILARCLASIVRQTLSDVEVIVIRDGGGDDCATICNGFAQQYDNVHALEVRGATLAKAYDTGISMAHGQYIMFVKADDFIAPNACELMYANAVKHDSDLVKCGIADFSSDKEVFLIPKWEEGILGNIPETDEVFTLDRHKELLTYHGAVYATLFKTEFIRDMKFSDGCGAAYQEFAFIIKSMICATRISVVKDWLYLWNINAAEYAVPGTSETLIGILEPFEAAKQWMIAHDCFDNYMAEFYKQVMIITMGFYEFISDNYKPEFFKRLQQFYSDVNMFIFPRVSCMFSQAQVRFLIEILKDN